MKNKFEIRGEVTAIFLNRRDGNTLETIIDTSMLEQIADFPYTWCASWNSCTNSFYCYGKLRTETGERKSILLHRWVTNCPQDMEVDHINNDTLDNTQQNLRTVTSAENHQNRLGAQYNSRTGIRGVSWNKRKRKWQAALKVENRRMHLGYFIKLSDAESEVKNARKDYMPFSKEALIA